jgi:hypothetical protein
MRCESGRNKIAKRFEETKKVKRQIYFVKREILQKPNQASRRFALVNADQKNLPRMNANGHESPENNLSG